MSEQTWKVYVVAWEYKTGGGFDWYFTPEAADIAFEQEKKNCDDPILKRENWTAARYDFDTHFNPKTESEKVSREIDIKCCELFKEATVKYKRGQLWKNP